MTEAIQCWKFSRTNLLLLAVAAALLLAGSWDTIGDMMHRWDTKEEYGYGYMIPAVTMFLIWQKKNELVQLPFGHSWIGVAVVVFSATVFFMGTMATTHTLSQYAMVLFIMGAALAMLGWRAFKLVAMPLALLFSMVPLPPFIFNTLSTQLQLVSSEIGVAVIRLFDIAVYLEGNVIDLGEYKLQVVEACSGLRYLFPLIVLSFIAAYLYRAEFWKKLIVFLSSIPITVLMNSFRIGVIGVLVEYYGIEQAEGFLHDFEGWIIFMACIGILVLEMVILSKIGKARGRLSEVFAVDIPEELTCTVSKIRPIPGTYTVVVIMAGLLLAGSMYAQTRTDLVTPRKQFSEFPLSVGEWRGGDEVLEGNILESLKLDDYILANYKGPNGNVVNFYVAYYVDQVAGEAAHSPRACIPGGGWLIKKHEVVEVAGVSVSNEPLTVNRMIIKKGDFTQIVYYWFQQRGRVITNEYMVKWYLFWDALTQNRTDGSLVRLTALVPPGENIEEGDEQLRSFAALVVPKLGDYIPE